MCLQQEKMYPEKWQVTGEIPAVVLLSLCISISRVHVIHLGKAGRQDFEIKKNKQSQAGTLSKKKKKRISLLDTEFAVPLILDILASRTGEINIKLQSQKKRIMCVCSIQGFL